MIYNVMGGGGGGGIYFIIVACVLAWYLWFLCIICMCLFDSVGLDEMVILNVLMTEWKFVSTVCVYLCITL